ncbi:MAG: multifunctional transcriptional regulator/nicotinamide-nucleotide adenylyltransferase/ribosylnicotinamide kinase NadR [Lysinibacillus sp.]
MNYGVQVKEYKGQRIGYYGGKFLPFHYGHLDCILKAQSMVDILFVVVGYDVIHDGKVCESTAFEHVSHRVRERWITKELKGFKNIRVLSQYERRSNEYMNDPTIKQSYEELLNKIGGTIDVVFSSEKEYGDYFEKYLPGAKHVVIDENRINRPISATKIRKEGVYAHWNNLPKSVQEYYTKRVAICGIESAGKSHIVKMLAKYFDTNYVGEYGRSYYDEINGFQDISQPSDYLDIAVGHCHLMNEASKKSNKLLMVDTDLSYTQFFYFLENERFSKVIDELIRSKAEGIEKYIYIEPYNFHELDGTRRHLTNEERNSRNNLLKSIYENYEIDLVIVDEVDRSRRFEKCVEAIKDLF